MGYPIVYQTKASGLDRNELETQPDLMARFPGDSFFLENILHTRDFGELRSAVQSPERGHRDNLSRLVFYCDTPGSHDLFKTYMMSLEPLRMTQLIRLVHYRGDNEDRQMVTRNHTSAAVMASMVSGGRTFPPASGLDWLLCGVPIHFEHPYEYLHRWRRFVAGLAIDALFEVMEHEYFDRFHVAAEVYKVWCNLRDVFPAELTPTGAGIRSELIPHAFEYAFPYSSKEPGEVVGARRDFETHRMAAHFTNPLANEQHAQYLFCQLQACRDGLTGPNDWRRDKEVAEWIKNNREKQLEHLFLINETKKFMGMSPMVDEEKEMEQYYVQIIETATGKVEASMGPMWERQAERVQRGAQINLNHDTHHVVIVPEESVIQEDK